MSQYDIVLHVDKTDGSLNIAFTNAVNYAAALDKEPFHMVLVVNSQAVMQLVEDNNKAVGHALEKAVEAGLEIRVCRNALESTGTAAEDLHPACSVVPAGLVEIVDLQRKGYAYIKP